MRVTDTHVFFWGSYLSNFWLSPIESTKEMAVPGLSFVCSEQAFMVEKAAFFKDQETLEKMLLCEDGASVKALGRQVKGFDEDEWYKVSYSKMLLACKAKFQQNSMLAKRLVQTGGRTLVEASPTDKIWGIGLWEGDDKVLDEKNWNGENRLGRVLMEVRDGFPRQSPYSYFHD
jgi:hypothetical protein